MNSVGYAELLKGLSREDRDQMGFSDGRPWQQLGDGDTTGAQCVFIGRTAGEMTDFV